jgi:hypothetical protein
MTKYCWLRRRASLFTSMMPFCGMLATAGAGKPTAIDRPVGGTNAFVELNTLFCLTGKL